MSKYREIQDRLTQITIMDDLHEIANDVKDRKEAQRLANMTPEERESYLKAKEPNQISAAGCVVFLFVFFVGLALAAALIFGH